MRPYLVRKFSYCKFVTGFLIRAFTVVNGLEFESWEIRGGRFPFEQFCLGNVRVAVSLLRMLCDLADL